MGNKRMREAAMRTSCGGPVRGIRCGGHTSKQVGKALCSQGHPHRKKRSRILAMYVHKHIRVCTQVG